MQELIVFAEHSILLQKVTPKTESSEEVVKLYKFTMPFGETYDTAIEVAKELVEKIGLLKKDSFEKEEQRKKEQADATSKSSDSKQKVSVKE